METNDKRNMSKPPVAATNPGDENGNAPIGTTADLTPERGNGKRTAFYAILAILLIIGGVVGFHYWQYATTHESTDDAQITADVVQISPQINGTLTHVLVHDNQHVNAGDLLVQFDDAPFRAALAEAQANLGVAEKAAEGAGVNVALVKATAKAQEMQAQGSVNLARGSIGQAQGGVGQADSGFTTAVTDTDRAGAAVNSAQASEQGARASEESAQAAAQSARDGVKTASAAIDAAQANESRAEAAVITAGTQVEAAKATLSAAHAAVRVAQANAKKADSDAGRIAVLFQNGAVSASLVDSANAAKETADAQVDSAKEQVNAAQAALEARSSDYDAAKDQVNAAKATVAQASAAREQAQSAVIQAEAQIKAVHQQVMVAAAGVQQSQIAQREIGQNVHLAQAKRQQSQGQRAQAQGQLAQAQGQLAQAQTGAQQVKASLSSQEQALAKVKQAQAALNAAQIQLDYTRIVAPVAGRISAKSAEDGALVVLGTPLMSIIPDEHLWVTANYKETQLTYMQPGQYAEVTADAFPDCHFHGKVDSISAGSGATFALLPPDNATGNFTKVVQRIPVKIVLDPDQPGLERLRAGMSVEAGIKVK